MSAFQVKPKLDPLAREAREIERRRERLNERTRRVLHPKTRLIGIDTQALQQQVTEKQDRERLELERDLFYDANVVQQARSVTEMEAQRQRTARKEREELNFYRKAQNEVCPRVLLFSSFPLSSSCRLHSFCFH